ncbi:MAG: hypothetical protein ABI600_18865 [Luteolibacter sp.]
MKTLGLSLVIASVGCSSGPGPVIPKSRTERQMIGLLEKFDRWDDNGDGELTETELNHGINRFKGTPAKVHYTGKEIIDFYDTNKDGRVTLREAQAGYARSGEAEQIIKSRN